MINLPEPLHTELHCIECSRSYSIEEVLFRCPECDGLLEVKHDLDALAAAKTAEWKKLFEERYRTGPYPLDSGVWGKKEWVLPRISNDHIVSVGEGASPMVRLEKLAKDWELGGLMVKQCGVSHTGSFKDLGMTVLVSHVVALKAAGKKIRAVACASTGDTSAALAAYASRAGIPVIVFLPAGKISTAQLVQPLSNGAIVLSLDTDFDGCMAVVKELTQDHSIYLANSMNPLRIEGQKTISIEIAQQLNWEVPDWVVIPGGNLGNVSALAAGFTMLYHTGLIDRKPRICVAQSSKANPLYLSFKNDFSEYKPVQAGKTQASAIQIGNPVSYPRAVRALKEYEGVVEQATEDELSNVSAETDRYGLFNDPHTGVALACLKKLKSQNIVSKTDKVVVISTAHGLKFSEFKTGYHRSVLPEVHSEYANSPVESGADVNEVRQTIEKRLNGV